MTTFFQWDGWHSGKSDCVPPEPGKEWLAINLMDDGEVVEEYAVIVLRTDNAHFREHPDSREERERRAQFIVDALNEKACQ